jgi:transcriptional regulator with XRE-family HTH domain
MTGPNLVRAPRIARECTHKRARHQHGTATMYKLDRCRCVPCTDAATAEERRRRLDAFIGTEPRRVDAGPVREHVRSLQAAGIGYKRVAALAGVAPSTVAKIIHRDPSRADGGPRARVEPETARRILAVRAAVDTVSDGGVIDGTGTLRRLHALHARGWSRRALAARLGVEHNTLTHIEKAETSSGRLARAVRALYEELWDQAPPSATPAERAAITRTLRWAEQHQWVPPAAWDDDLIDDPSAVPAVQADEEDDVVARLDELVFLAGMGEDLDRAARRLGWGSWEAARHRATQRQHRAARLRSEASEVAA